MSARAPDDLVLKRGTIVDGADVGRKGLSQLPDLARDASEKMRPDVAISDYIQKGLVTISRARS